MNVSELLQNSLNLEIRELDNLIYELKLLRSGKFYSKYKEIEVFPGNRIEQQIVKETGLYCYRRPCEGYSIGRGAHVIVVPIELYSKELKEKLISTYDYL